MEEQRKRKKKVAKPEGFIGFSRRFGPKDACRDRLFEIREAAGFACPKCGCSEYCRIKKQRRLQCRKCRRQVTLASGTVMDGTRMPLRKRFRAICLVTTDKRGVSAKEPGRRLHVSCHTAWFVLHRLRTAMGNPAEKRMPGGIAEFDDSYFAGPGPDGGDGPRVRQGEGAYRRLKERGGPSPAAGDERRAQPSGGGDQRVRGGRH